MKLDSRVADGFTGVWSAPISRASRAASPWARRAGDVAPYHVVRAGVGRGRGRRPRRPASPLASPWVPFLLYPDFATSLTLRGIARDKKRGILKTAISRLHSGGGFRIILSVFLTEGWPSG